MFQTIALRILSIALATSVLLVTLAAPADAVTLEWVRQIGTSGGEISHGVSADGLGNIYISGSTSGSLGGPHLGQDDAFVSKFDVAGNLLWTTQTGTATRDVSYGVSADRLGNVFMAGYTRGPSGDAGYIWNGFVSNLDPSGNVRWTRYLASSRLDESLGVSADGLGNVYVTGRTTGDLGGPSAGHSDAFVSKYDAAGNHQWTRQFGTSEDDQSYAVSADSRGNVYIAGMTGGTLGESRAGRSDAFVSKFNAWGESQWNKQFGTRWGDLCLSVASDDSGNVYLAGFSDGSDGAIVLPYIPFLSKYDLSGSLLWSHPIEARFNSFFFSSLLDGLEVSVDRHGGVFVSGYAYRGGTGNMEAFVSKYDYMGNHSWTERLGAEMNVASSFGVSTDGLGGVYITGYAIGSLGGPNTGSSDAFVAKFFDPVVPEPGSWLLAALVGVAALCGRMPRTENPRFGETRPQVGEFLRDSHETK